MRKNFCGCLVGLLLGLSAGQAGADVISCVCIGAPGLNGCGNGGATGTKGQSTFVSIVNLSNYLKDKTAYQTFIDKGEAFDRTITGWMCKRY